MSQDINKRNDSNADCYIVWALGWLQILVTLLPRLLLQKQTHISFNHK